MEQTPLRLLDYYLRIIIIIMIIIIVIIISLVRIPTSLKSAVQRSPLFIIYYIEYMGTQRYGISSRYFSGGNPNKALQFMLLK